MSHIEEEKVTDLLVYEIIDGQNIFYKGYQAVLEGTQNLEDIMGCSDIQGLVIRSILKYLFKYVDGEDFTIITNEIGLHLNKNNNLAADIAIFQKKALQKATKKKQYFEIPPEAVIEVDIQASVEGSVYYQTKTQKLLDFGVKEVIWIFTENKKISFAKANQEHWLTFDWSQAVILLDQYQFNLADLLKEDGLV